MKPTIRKSSFGFSVFLIVAVLALGSLLIPQGSTGATDKIDSDGMLYVAHWTHTPENCPGRSKDGAQMLHDFWAKRDEAAKKGVKVLGGYVGVTEHTYLILVQAKDYQAMLEFFLPLVPTQTGKIRPVTTMDEWTKFIQPK
jgi:hypothetical protein